jgi:hypothetical protein
MSISDFFQLLRLELLPAARSIDAPTKRKYVCDKYFICAGDPGCQKIVAKAHGTLGALAGAVDGGTMTLNGGIALLGLLKTE